MNAFWIAIAYLLVGATVGVIAMSLAVMAKGERSEARTAREREWRVLR